MNYRFLTGDRVDFEPAVSALHGMHSPRCWGCGPEAEQGLGLVPRVEGSLVLADLEFASRFEGGPGTVHGGALSEFVDDLLGYVPISYGAPGVTARLDTNFIAPVPIGGTVRGTAWMSRVDDRKMWAEGTIEIDGDVLVESSGLFLAIGPEHFDQAATRFSNEERERFEAYRFGSQ